MWPLVIGGGLGVAAAGAYAYGATAPQSQWFGATTASGANSRHLALTYDDGPNPSCTPQLLEVLARHDVKATFFLIGRFAAQQPVLAREIAAAGHAIGNHTQTHPNLFLASPAQVRRELAECNRALSDAVGFRPALFRPPFGFRRPGVLRAARALGLTPVMWSVTCYDWKPVGAERIEQYAIRKIATQRDRGHIILLHDGGHRQMGADRHATVAATDNLIRRYKGEGREFVTVTEMIAHRGAAESRERNQVRNV